MVLNKKGSMLNLWFLIVMFNIFIAVSFTILVGFSNLATSEIVEPIHDITKDIANGRTSVEIQNHIDSSFESYKDNIFPWDLIIFALMINFYFFLIFSAIQQKGENPFILFSLLTFGSIFFLLLISISVDVQEWVIGEIYQDVFETSVIDTPLMDYVFQNMGMISFIMALVLVVINQFDKLKTMVFKRLEEE